MRTWTVVVSAVAAQREACVLAARGKDLVLIDKDRAPLEVLAAELRVVHRVDVRILVVDLARDGADEAVRWLRDRDRSVDGIVAASCDRALRPAVQKLAAAFVPEMRRHGLGSVLCVSRHGVSDELGDRRTSEAGYALPPRARTTTQRGWADPYR